MFLLCIACTLFLTGCWDVHEPERMYYIHGVGVDFKDGEYRVYFQIIDFIKVAKSEQPAPEAIQAEIGVSKGKTLDEALFKLYRSMDERVYWGHLTYIIFSEQLVKNMAINTVIDTFNRYRDTRYQTWVYFTRGSVKEILLATPILNKGITLSKLSDPENSYNQHSFVEPINLRTLITDLNEPNHEVAIPHISMKENWDTEKGKDNVTFLKGVGVITPKEFKGYIDNEKISGLQWMTKKTERGEVTVKIEGDGGNFYTIVLSKIKVDVKSVIEKGEAKFDIRLKVFATLSSIQGKASIQKIEQAVKEKVKEEVMITYKEALEQDIDIYRLSEYLYRQNVKSWKGLQEKGKVPLTEHSIRSLTVDITKLTSGRKTFTKTID